MTIHLDPSRAPTRADAAYDRALDKKEARLKIICEEFKRAAENAEARLKQIGVAFTDGHRLNCANWNARQNDNLTPLEYLAACTAETADEAFEQLQSPEDAADDEWFREGDTKQERD